MLRKIFCIIICSLFFRISADAQICFSENAINYSRQTGEIFMSFVSAGLLNNDAFPDVAFSDLHSVFWRYGDGTGNYVLGPQVILNGDVVDLDVTDMDSDGYQDMVVVESSYKLHIFYNDGTGVFSDSIYLSPVSFGGYGKLLIEDLDGDNLKDIILPAYGLSDVITFNNNGSRQFNIGSFTVPFNIGAAAIGKIDSDTLFDLVIVNGINYVPFFGNGSGFTAGTPVPKLSQMETIGIADMNNDGNSDIIYTMALSASVDYYNSSGTITSTTNIDVQQGNLWHYVSADDMLIFDSDNDNYPEVIVPSQFNYSVGVVNNTGGNLSFTQYVAAMGCSTACVNDYNLDGLYDIITVGWGVADYFSIFRNESGGNFHGDVYLIARFGPAQEGQTLATGDVNSDGFTDILTHSYDSINVIMNDGTGHFSVAGSFYADIAVTTQVDGTPLAAADFNNDNNLDVVFSNDAHQVLLMTGDGNGNFQPPVVIAPWITFPYAIASGQFNNDTIPDIAFGINSAISIMLNNGSGLFSQSGTIPNSGYVYGITVNDFNGDGVDDIAFIQGQAAGALYINNGSGVFTFGDGYSTCLTGDLNGISSGDLNNDGNMDVAITDSDCQFPPRVRLFEGDGTGQLNPAGFINVFQTPLHTVITDINFDGKADVVTNSMTGIITVAIKSTVGYSTYQLASGATSLTIVAADFNNDNKPDLAYDNGYSTDIGVALNNLIKIYPATQISACSGDSVMLYITDTVPGFEWWPNGETNDTIYVSSPGMYFVTADSVSLGTCFGSTRAWITFGPLVPVTFDGTSNPDTTCINQPVILDALPPGGVFSGSGVTGNVFDPASLIPNQSYTLSYSYDSLGCISSADFNIYVAACVGINEVVVHPVKVSPIPAKDQLFIEQEISNGYSWCELFTAYGELVIKIPLYRNKEMISTSSLSPGIYFLKFSNPEKDMQQQVKRISVIK